MEELINLNFINKIFNIEEIKQIKENNLKLINENINLKKINNNLLLQNNNLKTQLFYKDEGIECLLNTLKYYFDINNDYEIKINNLNNYINSKEKEIDIILDNLSKLKNEINDLKNGIVYKNIIDENVKLHNDINDLNNNINNLKDNYDKLNNINEQNISKINELNLIINEKDIKLNNLNKELEKINLDNKNNIDNFKSLNEEYLKNIDDYNNLQKDYLQFKELYDKQKNIIDNEFEDFKKINDDNLNLKNKIETLNKQIDDYKNNSIIISDNLNDLFDLIDFNDANKLIDIYNYFINNKSIITINNYEVDEDNLKEIFNNISNYKTKFDTYYNILLKINNKKKLKKMIIK